MARPSFNWNSFWDLASPEQAAEALVRFYGSDAARAAAECALAADADNRDDDYRFWLAVFHNLRAVERQPAAAVACVTAMH